MNSEPCQPDLIDSPIKSNGDPPRFRRSAILILTVIVVAVEAR